MQNYQFTNFIVRDLSHLQHNSWFLGRFVSVNLTIFISRNFKTEEVKSIKNNLLKYKNNLYYWTNLLPYFGVFQVSKNKLF